jgi:lysophospholipase L1-like esterase
VSRRSALAATVLVGLAASLLTVHASPAAGASYPNDLVWLALGDSFSSGEGLRYVDQDANPPGDTCERATGRTSVNNGQGSRAWAAVAYDQVRGAMTNSTFRLLACTGATSNQIHDQYREWFAESATRADLMTFSMGGNNLGFRDIVMRCIGLSIDYAIGVGTGAGVILDPAIGCDTTETELKAAIDKLVGTSGVGPDGGQTLRDMYREIAENAVNPGGHVIVAGYPNVVEESGRWVMGWLEGNRCSRIRRSDAAMLRSVNGYLNQQIANLVTELNGYKNVSFHWLDVSQIYENQAGRHGLCTEEPWINGITVGLAGPDSGFGSIRYQRSFHPNQKGHNATGTATADRIPGLKWDNLKRIPPGPDANDEFPLRVGSAGERVRISQTYLIGLGFLSGTPGADGRFGPGTEAAVKAWQKAAGDQVTGRIENEQQLSWLRVDAESMFSVRAPCPDLEAAELPDTVIAVLGTACGGSWGIVVFSEPPRLASAVLLQFVDARWVTIRRFTDITYLGAEDLSAAALASAGVDYSMAVRLLEAVNEQP